jgi:hypothetical protein
LLVSTIRAYGAATRVPSLWVYAENDGLFGPELVERMRTEFLESGGDARLVRLPSEGKDGHRIFSSARRKWLPEMDGFLRSLKLPTWNEGDVNELMRRGAVEERTRAFLEEYVAGPSEKALVREKGGSYFGVAYGYRTVEQAGRSALDSCQRTKRECELIMENNRWVGAEL